MWFVYILFSESGKKYYSGSSQNPELRLHYHNSTEKGYTARYRPWKLVFRKEFESKQAAQAAERKVKSWKSKKMIEKVIHNEVTL